MSRVIVINHWWQIGLLVATSVVLAALVVVWLFTAVQRVREDWFALRARRSVLREATRITRIARRTHRAMDREAHRQRRS